MAKKSKMPAPANTKDDAKNSEVEKRAPEWWLNFKQILTAIFVTPFLSISKWLFQLGMTPEQKAQLNADLMNDMARSGSMAKAEDEVKQENQDIQNILAERNKDPNYTANPLNIRSMEIFIPKNASGPNDRAIRITLQNNTQYNHGKTIDLRILNGQLQTKNIGGKLPQEVIDSVNALLKEVRWEAYSTDKDKADDKQADNPNPNPAPNKAPEPEVSTPKDVEWVEAVVHKDDMYGIRGDKTGFEGRWGRADINGLRVEYEIPHDARDVTITVGLQQFHMSYNENLKAVCLDGPIDQLRAEDYRWLTRLSRSLFSEEIYRNSGGPYEDPTGTVHQKTPVSTGAYVSSGLAEMLHAANKENPMQQMLVFVADTHLPQNQPDVVIKVPQATTQDNKTLYACEFHQVPPSPTDKVSAPLVAPVSNNMSQEKMARMLAGNYLTAGKYSAGFIIVNEQTGICYTGMSVEHQKQFMGVQLENHGGCDIMVSDRPFAESTINMRGTIEQKPVDDPSIAIAKFAQLAGARQNKNIAAIVNDAVIQCERVSVWCVKDAQNNVMKNEDGSPIIIPEGIEDRKAWVQEHHPGCKAGSTEQLIMTANICGDTRVHTEVITLPIHENATEHITAKATSLYKIVEADLERIGMEAQADKDAEENAQPAAVNDETELEQP